MQAGMHVVFSAMAASLLCKSTMCAET